MNRLTHEFLEQCPIDKGFRLRGLDMTRTEVFVDAAFAFAVTMLVISFDEIPSNYEEIMAAIKSIPAFIVAVAQLVWIWHTHNIWSRRFGLDTTYTVVISSALLIVVLIYVYPMRIMASGMFSWMTSGYLSTNFMISGFSELRNMFIFLSIGFIALSLIFVEMYRYAKQQAVVLKLSDEECYQAQSVIIMWLGGAFIGGLCILLALVLSEQYVPFSGFAYALLGIWFPAVTHWRSQKQIIN